MSAPQREPLPWLMAFSAPPAPPSRPDPRHRGTTPVVSSPEGLDALWAAARAAGADIHIAHSTGWAVTARERIILVWGDDPHMRIWVYITQDALTEWLRISFPDDGAREVVDVPPGTTATLDSDGCVRLIACIDDDDSDDDGGHIGVWLWPAPRKVAP